MDFWVTLNDLVHNLAVLVAGVTVLTFTLNTGTSKAWFRFALKCAGYGALGLYLMANSLLLADGLRFDFRGVVVALVARRYGVLPALLVALPMGAYRLMLGGEGTVVAVLHLALLALVGAARTGWIRLHPPFHDEPLARRWWSPFALFAGVNLIFFPAFRLAGHPWTEALTIYGMTTLLSALGLFLAYEVKHSRLRSLAYTAHFKHLAAADGLTGCFNRRQFDADLLQVEEPAYLLLLDLDLFKRVNDTYGHDAGDRVLVAFAETLRSTARATDRVYRLGGEEFAVLYGAATFHEAEQAAERLRQVVEATLAARAHLPGEQLTFSGGLVPVRGDRDRALPAADRQLYAAKQAGRNCIRHGVIPSW